ncbi:putative ATP-dependent RNA helicase DDX43 isoform X3 [Tachypleus tridentatus]|uniref:putative ATP-dependent RNA helicase DDX43 isoform X3 n=2 Tax=Tachypleus tridentatus TaxID=6853 RepID=UPI003FD618EF
MILTSLFCVVFICGCILSEKVKRSQRHSISTCPLMSRIHSAGLVQFDEEAWQEDRPGREEYIYNRNVEFVNSAWSRGSTTANTQNYYRERRNAGSRSRRQGDGRADKDCTWRNRGSEHQESTETVIVSSRDVGRIIGRGGSKVRELEEQSGARIQIKSNENGGIETTVVLRGPGHACSKAKKMIEDLLYQKSQGGHSESRQINRPECAFQDAEEKIIDWSSIISQSEEYQKKKWKDLPPIKKNFYFEDPDVTCMHPDDVALIRYENNNIVVSKLDENDNRPIPNPVWKFEQGFKHFSEILDEINKQGFEHPSPVQCQSWPILLQGYDMIGIAQTGTGKTIAFLLPALIHIDNQVIPREQRPGPTCLILVPTRELAQQIEREARKYEYKGIKSVCIYGGGNRKEQIKTAEKGVEIVIATPGRLNDLVMNNVINVSSVTYLVLDEADRMLDMGFEPQIKKILLDIRPDRQTVMTSATWPEGVRRLARQYMTQPFQAVHSVTQKVLIIPQEEKRRVLYEFIQDMKPDDKVIVFVDKKIVADDLASDLAVNGIVCQCIHGDREQCDREQALEDLRTGEVQILIATDVASRGLDIKDITHIFNYDFPRNVEEYVHRVGRTGRAGQTGESVTLVTRENWRNAQELIHIMEEAGQDIPEDLVAMADRYAAWKEKKDAEDAVCRRGRGRGSRAGFGGRRRRDDWP